jgi:hypothetical protein
MMKNSWFGLLIKYYCSDQMEEKEMGEACVTYGTEGKCACSFGMETWQEEATWKTEAYVRG